MKIQLEIKGTSPYSPSKALVQTKQANEAYEDFESRIWIEKCHFNKKNEVVLPIFGLKAMLDSTASYLGEKIRGKGNKTYAKKFRAGVIFQGENPLLLMDGKPITKTVLEKNKDTQADWVYCHSDGKRDGKAGRVHRLFPRFDNWSTKFEINVIDPDVTEDVLIRHMVAAGLFNGIGRFRPQNGGSFGRFEVLFNGKSQNCEFTDVDDKE